MVFVYYLSHLSFVLFSLYFCLWNNYFSAFHLISIFVILAITFCFVILFLASGFLMYFELTTVYLQVLGCHFTSGYFETVYFHFFCTSFYAPVVYILLYMCYITHIVLLFFELAVVLQIYVKQIIFDHVVNSSKDLHYFM